MGQILPCFCLLLVTVQCLPTALFYILSSICRSINPIKSYSSIAGIETPVWVLMSIILIPSQYFSRDHFLLLVQGSPSNGLWNCSKLLSNQLFCAISGQSNYRFITLRISSFNFKGIFFCNKTQRICLKQASNKPNVTILRHNSSFLFIIYHWFFFFSKNILLRLPPLPLLLPYL